MFLDSIYSFSAHLLQFIFFYGFFVVEVVGCIAHHRQDRIILE